MMTIELHVRFRWWVWPFLWAALMFWRSVEPFIDLDQQDARAMKLADAVGDIIAKYGSYTVAVRA